MIINDYVTAVIPALHSCLIYLHISHSPQPVLVTSKVRYDICLFIDNISTCASGDCSCLLVCVFNLYRTPHSTLPVILQSLEVLPHLWDLDLPKNMTTQVARRAEFSDNFLKLSKHKWHLSLISLEA